MSLFEQFRGAVGEYRSSQIVSRDVVWNQAFVDVGSLSSIALIEAALSCLHRSRLMGG